MHVSRQKIYDSLLEAKKKYKSLRYVAAFVSYTKIQGFRINFIPRELNRKDMWIKNTLDVTDCLKHETLFDQADAIAIEIETWINTSKIL